MIGNLEKELLLLGTGIGESTSARDTSFVEKTPEVVEAVLGLIRPYPETVENFQSEKPGQSVQQGEVKARGLTLFKDRLYAQ